MNETHIEIIKTHIKKCGPSLNDVDDLTQDALLLASQNWERFDPVIQSRLDTLPGLKARGF